LQWAFYPYNAFFNARSGINVSYPTWHFSLSTFAFLNFFAHFYFDHRLEQHPYNTGLVLPDFLRNFLPGSRVRVEQLAPAQGDSEVQALWEGCLMHLERDRHFHGSAYFKEADAALKELFRREGLGKTVPRTWLAAHLLVELMLDRVLMKQAPALLDAFYHSLRNTPPTATTRFLEDAQLDAVTFLQRLERFNSVAYLYHYPDDGAMTYSLMRIYMQAKVTPEWTLAQQEAVRNLLPEAEAIVTERISLL
jgi:hypothetical protein